MKKSLLLTLVLLLATALAPLPAFACGDGSVDENGVPMDNCEMAAEEESSSAVFSTTSSLESAYFASDATIESSADVTHSYFEAGNSVTTNSVVDGVHLVAGNLLNTNGTSEYSFFAGNSLNINSETARDLFFAGNTVVIGEGAYIGRDVFGVGNLITVSSNLNGNVFLAGNRLVLENITINGDLSVDFDEIVIKGRSAVSGTFKYNENASIVGLENLNFSTVETYQSSPASSSLLARFLSGVRDFFVGFLGLLLVIFVLIALAPKFMQRLLDAFRWSTAWKFLGLGLGLIVVVPLACLLVLVTIIGIPIAGLTFGLYFAFICLSQGITGGIVGNEIATRLLKKPKLNLYLKYTLGLVLIRLLCLVPILGGLVTAVTVCFGFGYLSKHLFIRK